MDNVGTGGLLLVHAHPDDESIATGAVMARYSSQGVAVTLLTCTLGEQGEILVPDLAWLAADHADQLGGFRIGELAAAVHALGVDDHRFLGGAGRFRDSGMMGDPANDHARAFWRAAAYQSVFDEAVAAAVAVIREVRPQVLVTYDDNGDYGHPDHIMAHRVATAAVQRAADPDYRGSLSTPWQVAKVYWTATPKSELAAELDEVRTRPDLPFDAAAVEDLPFGVEDSVITTAVDVSDFVEAKLAALAAHRTQVVIRAPFYALSNMIGRSVGAREYFRLVQGTLGDDRDADGRERDLFAGIEEAT